MIIKRLFDLLLSLAGLIISFPLILLLIFIASCNTRSFGLFCQKRVGRFGEKFTIYKIKTMHPVSKEISPWSNFMRKTKLDELPQLANILLGDMSFVGPRPDIAGYYDILEGENRLLLNLRPGLTSVASIKYKDEDRILSLQENPLSYNDSVIFPDKVQLNLHYYYNQTFILDLIIIWKTIFR